MPVQNHNEPSMLKNATRFALLFFVLLSLIHVFMGRSFLDSGFYLYAAKLVYQGQVPYRDFFFVQPPVYPYVYGLPLKIFGPSILAGRLTSLVLGLLTLCLAVRLARKIGGRKAGFITAGLLGFNAFLAYNFSVAKLYALTGLLLTAAMLLFHRYLEKGRGIVLPSLLLALTTGTRIALLPLAALLFLLILLHERKLNRTVWSAVIAYGAGTAAIYLPFVFLSSLDVLFYHLAGIHAGADAAGPYHFGLANKILVMSKLVRDNFFFCFLFTASFFFSASHLRKTRSATRSTSNFFFYWLPAVAFVFFIVHFATNWFTTDYLTIIFPLAAVIAGCRLSRFEILSYRFFSPLGYLFLAGCLLGAFAYGKKDIMFHEGRYVSPYFPELARFVRANVPPGERIAPLNPLIAIETQRDVVHGFEGMPATYTPDWDDHKCRLFNSLNDNRLAEIFRNREAAAVIVDAGMFGISFPRFMPVSADKRQRIMRTLEAYYRPAAAFPPFAEGGSRVRVYLPK
jgi:hypothetical protein